MNSSERWNGTTSNYSIKFGNVLKHANIVDAYVSATSFPRTNYLVNSNNNTFVFHPSGGVEETIVLPSRNYTGNILCTIIEGLIPHMSCTHLTSTNKILFAYVKDFEFKFHGDNSCARILGFEAESNYASTSHTLQSNNVIQLVNDNMITIRLEQFAGPCNGPILHFFNYENYYYGRSPKKNFCVTFNSKLNVKILDSSGKEIDFNNVDHTFVLNLTFIQWEVELDAFIAA